MAAGQGLAAIDVMSRLASIFFERAVQKDVGYHLYYPTRRQQTAAFKVVLEALRSEAVPT